MQDNQDTEPSTDEVQSTREYKESLAGGMDVCVVFCKYKETSQKNKEKKKKTKKIQREHKRRAGGGGEIP